MVLALSLFLALFCQKNLHLSKLRIIAKRPNGNDQSKFKNGNEF